jgi:hypothetical protein
LRLSLSVAEVPILMLPSGSLDSGERLGGSGDAVDRPLHAALPAAADECCNR